MRVLYLLPFVFLGMAQEQTSTTATADTSLDGTKAAGISLNELLKKVDAENHEVTDTLRSKRWQDTPKNFEDSSETKQ